MQCFIVFILGLKALYTFSKFTPVFLFEIEREDHLLITNVEGYNRAHGIVDLISTIPLIVMIVLSFFKPKDYLIETLFYLGIVYPILLFVSHSIIKKIHTISHDHEQPFTD
jgi:hypothetical protein